MNVLLVDDQINILSGLVSGLDWDALGITSVKTATNSFQAKAILEKEPVDVLLCDIEMPGENGLALLRWARNQNMNFVCVFLTSHADFMYAKEAMSLNCFDYILQPARYEDIQATIAKAIARVKKDKAEKKLEQYGIIAQIHAPGLFQNLFSDWASGKVLSISTLCNSLRQLGHNVQPEDNCMIILGHILRWHSAPWHTEEWVFTMNNIITEVYETNHFGILSFTIDSTSMGWLVYSLSGHFYDPGSIMEPLNCGYSVISAHMRCDLAFYCSPVAPLKQINVQSEKLFRAKKDNVLPKSGVFTADGSTEPFLSKCISNIQVRRWGELLAKKEGPTAREEIFRFFDEASARGLIDYEFLHIFWIQFQQITLNALWTLGWDVSKMLPLLEHGEKTHFLSEMLQVVSEVTDCFRCDQLHSIHEQNIVERTKRYLEDNIDLPLSARDVADALFINTDYLSRQLKKECGLTLKEFIIKCKMKSAQSMLRTTSLPVSVIASKLGYDNFSYFSQVYRRVMGISPTDERQN